jgi:hypothetical protein
MDRLYLVVRSDLSPGSQLAQSCHACGAYAAEHTSEYMEWVRGDCCIVCLNVVSERDLHVLLDEANHLNLHVAPFYEPDFGGALTAIAIEEGGRKLVANLPLALKNVRPTGSNSKKQHAEQK